MKHVCLTCEQSFYDDDLCLVCRKKKTVMDEDDSCPAWHEESEPCEKWQAPTNNQ